MKGAVAQSQHRNRFLRFPRRPASPSRTLAYVYLEDGTFLNAEIVKQGYGHAYTQFPFKYLDEFRGYEREARESQHGLWKP